MDVVAQRAVRPVEELDDAEALVDRVEQGPVALLAVGQRLARVHVLGDVADDADEADGPAGLVPFHVALAGNPADFAGIGPDDPVFGIGRDRAGIARGGGGGEAGIGRMDQALEGLRRDAVSRRHAESPEELRCRRNGLGGEIDGEKPDVAHVLGSPELPFEGEEPALKLLDFDCCHECLLVLIFMELEKLIRQFRQVGHPSRRVRRWKAMLKGHCLCGAIRYETVAPPTLECVCHCTMCRRAAGAPMVGWFTVPRGAYRVVAGTPASYRSSPEGDPHLLRHLRYAAHLRIDALSGRDRRHNLLARRR